MPTTTFENLAEDKKKRILQAAINEFAQYRFSEASINRIVKEAGIPRGSFYQYFKDKEDLYLLVIEKISREKLAILSSHPAPSEDATFFEAAIASIPAVLEWVERCPKYDRIGMLMAQDNSAWMQSVMSKMATGEKGVIAFLERDKKRGFIRPEVDLDLVIQAILPNIMTLLREYYTEGGSDVAIQKIKMLFDIIGNGIFCKEAHHERDCTAG